MRAFIFALCVFLWTADAYAAVQQQEKSSSSSAAALPEVVVTAKSGQKSLTVPTLAAARSEINRIPGGAAIVDAEEYKTGRVSTLQDTLGFTPGVFAQSRFGAEEARVSIRGSGIQRTFHLRGIKLLQDGIPVNQADGAGDFQAVEPLALQYTEVFRGANALQYGSTTLGGAINFVSPTGYDAPLVQGRFEAGGNNYLRDQISSGYVLGPADYYVSLSEFRQKGFRNHSDQETKRLYSNYGLKLGGNAETRFYVSLVDSKSKLPGSLTLGQMKQNPKQNAAANVTGNQKRDFDLVRLANKTTFKGDEQTFEAGAFYIHKDLFHPIFQVLDIITHDLGGMFRYVNQKDLLGRRNIFTLGFNPVWGIADDLRHANVRGERGVRTAESKQTSYNLDLYAEEQFYVFDKLALAGGFQWSFASRKTRDKFLPDGNNSGKPTYIGLSPKAGAHYDFTERSQAFANFSRSFEPPSFGELANVTGGGIFDLTEQTASTVEIGTRGQEGRFSWDTVYYYSWVENELLSLNDGQGNPLGTVNAHGTRHQGIEAGLGLDLLRGIWVKKDLSSDKIILRGVYNWSRFRFSKDPAFSNNPLPGIPEHFLKTEIVYEHPRGFYLGPNMEFASRYAVDMNHSLFTYPYALLGLKGGYRTKKGLSFFVEAKNLTNEIYAATTGIIANAGGADSAQFLPGDGRTVISGMEFKW